jgi:hypothetical protein
MYAFVASPRATADPPGDGVRLTRAEPIVAGAGGPFTRAIHVTG